MKWLKDILFREIKEPVIETRQPEYGSVICRSCDKWNRMEFQTLLEFTRQPLMYKVACLHCGKDVTYDPPPPKPKRKTLLTMEDLRLKENENDTII